MRVLPIHPVSEYNTGDLLTYYGSRNIMKHAFGEDVEFLHVDSRRAEAELSTYVPEYNWGDVDVILVCGSPFLGVDVNNTKCIMLKQAVERYPKAKRIALGVGSSFRHNNIYFNNYYDYSDRNANSNKKAIDNTKELFEDFDLVISRDSFTQGLLDLAKIKSEMYFDTSAFYYSGHGSKYRKDNLFIYSNPLTMDSWGHAPEGVWEIYNKKFLEYTKDYITIVITSQDKGYLDKAVINSLFCTDLEYLKYLYSNASSVTSAKVHQAIFAKCCGCSNVKLYNIDSRFLTVENFGITTTDPLIDLDIIPQHKTDYRLESIRKQGGKGYLMGENKNINLAFHIEEVPKYMDWYKERLVFVI
jgi:hypothetical protein